MDFVKSHPFAFTAFGAFLFHLLLGPLLFGGLAFPLLLVVWAGCGWAWWNGRKGSGASISPDGEPAKLYMTVRGELREAPAFLRPDARIFQLENTFVTYRANSGKTVIWKGKPLKSNIPEDVERASSVIIWSGVAERERRGYAVQNEVGDLLPLNLDGDHGVLVEHFENDDGSIDAIYAYDVSHSTDIDDFERAFKKNVTPPGSDWKDRKGIGDYGKNIGIAPLYHPLMKKVRIREAWSSPNPFQPRSTEHGSAQFAWIDEMDKSHSVEPGSDDMVPTNILLGGFNAANWSDDNKRDVAIWAKGEGHRIIVGPPGSGKFTAAIAPLLLSAHSASVFVFDVANGEAARVTAGWRSKLGPVLVLDPFGVTGLESGSLNPLDFIRADDPDILHAARNLTDALFIASSGGENAEYFNAQAKDVLTAYLLHVATSPCETDRTLRRIRELIRRPIGAELLAAMSENPVAGGMVADTAANLIEAVKSDSEKNTFYVTQTLRANTAFLDLPAVLRATERTTFDPALLRRQVSTLYVCLPEQQLGQVGRWLRLVYSTIMERVRVRTDVPLHVVIDEFPSLGHFSRVKDDMALVRKFGIHIHIASQSLTQLEAVYDKEWQSFMAAAKFQQLLGVNDHMTAEYFSRRLGTTTRRSTSSNQSRSSGGGSQGSNSGWMAHELMSADELGRLHPIEMIVAVEGMNPLRLYKLHYHQHDFFSERANLPVNEDLKTA